MLQAPQEHRAQSAFPQLFPSPPAKSPVTSHLPITCRPHLCLQTTFIRLLLIQGASQGCALPGPPSPPLRCRCPVLLLGVLLLPVGAARWVALFQPCPMEQRGVRSCCSGASLKPGDGDSCMGSVLQLSTGLAEQEVTGTLRAASSTGCLPCSTSLFFSQLRHTVTPAFTTPRPGLWLSVLDRSDTHSPSGAHWEPGCAQCSTSTQRPRAGGWRQEGLLLSQSQGAALVESTPHKLGAATFLPLIFFLLCATSS